MQNVEIFEVVITILLGLAMFLLNSFKGSIDSVTESINTLNTNVATLLANDENKDKIIQTNRDEIDKLRLSFHDIANKVAINSGKIEILENSKEKI